MLADVKAELHLLLQLAHRKQQKLQKVILPASH